jgi:uncharacterized protein (TIGR02466 family)
MKHPENNFKYASVIEAGIWSSSIKDLDIKYWIKSIYDYQNHFPKGVLKSNSGGYQSEDNLQSFQIFYPLVNQLNTLITNLFGNPNTKLISMWANISPPKSFNQPHTHNYSITSYHNTDISGVLYLKVPKDSGGIVFYDPLLITKNYTITPQPKDIILFHQHLPHSVDPNFSQEDRISVAFNFDKI